MQIGFHLVLSSSKELFIHGQGGVFYFRGPFFAVWRLVFFSFPPCARPAFCYFARP